MTNPSDIPQTGTHYCVGCGADWVPDTYMCAQCKCEMPPIRKTAVEELVSKGGAVMTKTLAQRLRERLIAVPKPGEKPFDPPPGWSHTMTVGGERKAGDDAGYMSINANMSGAAGLGQSTFKMQAMVYAVDPLCEEAAAANERLEGIEKAAAKAMRLWDADEVKAGIQAFKDLKQKLLKEPRSAPLAIGGYLTLGPTYLVGEIPSEQTVTRDVAARIQVPAGAGVPGLNIKTEER